MERTGERIKEAVTGDSATEHKLKSEVHSEMAKQAGLDAPGIAIKETGRAASEKIQQWGKEVKHGA
jgi:hypothetical protein